MATACLRPRDNLAGYMRAIVSPRTREFDRVAALVNLADKFIPGLAEAMSRLCQPTQLPFVQSATARLIGYGTGATVLSLSISPTPRALKILRRSFGKSLPEVLALAREFQHKHALLVSWYGDWVLPAEFVVIRGPIGGQPVAAIVQPYLAGPLADLFQDFSFSDLTRQMQADPHLAQQIRLFAEKTLQLYEHGEACLDIVGRENVVLGNRAGRWQLTVIDNGIFNLSILPTQRPGVLAELQQRLAQLQALLEVASQRI